MIGWLNPGPVFALECRAAARRWQLYAARAGLGLLMLAALAVVAASRDRSPRVAELFFQFVVLVQLAVVVVAVTASAAGSVCADRARGTLGDVLVTDLSAREIILGKALGRPLPAVALSLLSLPVVMICTLLGGLGLGAVVGAYAVTLGVAVLGVGVGVLLSVWCRRDEGAILAAAAGWAAVLLAGQLGSALGAGRAWDTLNPFLMALDPARVGLPGLDPLEMQSYYTPFTLKTGVFEEEPETPVSGCPRTRGLASPASTNSRFHPGRGLANRHRRRRFNVRWLTTWLACSPRMLWHGLRSGRCWAAPGERSGAGGSGIDIGGPREWAGLCGVTRD